MGGGRQLTGAFDPVHGTTITWDRVTGDTWLLKSGVWSRAHSVGTPPKTGGVLVYDSSQRKPLLLMTGGSPWVWDGSNWAQETLSVIPPPRDFWAAAFDSASGQALLYGGVGPSGSGIKYSDTWIHSGSNWVQVHTTHVPPAGVSYAVFDGNANRVLLIAQDLSTWSWSGTDWVIVNSLHKPTGSPVRLFASIGYSPQSKQVVLFGGKYDDPPALGAPTADTFVWNGIDWSSAK